MKTPEQVLALLRTRFEKYYPDWARGQGSWPMRIGLEQPTTAQRSADPLTCHAWAHSWREYSGPGEVMTPIVRFPTGLHSMPKTLVLARPGDVAAADPTTAATWQRCGRRLTELQRRFPRARFDRLIRRITDLTDADYDRLVASVEWLQAHPTSGMLLRQVPIEGIGTKWLAGHATLVLAMLGDDESAAISQTAGSGRSARIRLHQRLGLQVQPDLIRIAVLDPLLREHTGGMRHFAASVEDLNRWARAPRTVVILENNETAYAVTGDHPGVVVLHGQGFSVPAYARITWIRSAGDVIYWGDIDVPGLEFINDLRALGIPARSILMDLRTLQRYRHLAIDGAGPARTALPHLSPDEAGLYRRLLEHAAEHGTGLLLEQERIPWAHAGSVLATEMSPE